MSEAVAASLPLNPMAPAKGVGLVRAWLLVIAGLVYAMILVGGATRLTDSGLSITEWKPLLGRRVGLFALIDPVKQRSLHGRRILRLVEAEEV